MMFRNFLARPLLQFNKCKLINQTTTNLIRNFTRNYAIDASKKPINSILQIDKVLPLPASDVTKIWNLWFSQKPNTLSSSISSEFYYKFIDRLEKYPMFLLPLPRDPEGFEFFLMQSDVKSDCVIILIVDELV